MRHHCATAAFHRVVPIFTRARLVKASVVGVESAVKAASKSGVRVENHGTDECRGVISMRSQDCGSIGKLLRQRHLKIVHLMKLWIRSGEDGGVRWRSQRDLRISMGKNHGLAGQRVEVRRQSEL